MRLDQFDKKLNFHQRKPYYIQPKRTNYFLLVCQINLLLSQFLMILIRFQISLKKMRALKWGRSFWSSWIVSLGNQKPRNIGKALWQHQKFQLEIIDFFQGEIILNNKYQMRSTSCVHSSKYVTGHPSCLASCRLCEQHCVRIGHKQHPKHQIYQANDLLKRLTYQKNAVDNLTSAYITQIDIIYQQRFKRLQANKRHALNKLKAISQKQRNRRSNNNDYYNNLWSKMKLLETNYLQSLTCRDIEQFITEINNKTLQNELKNLLNQDKRREAESSTTEYERDLEKLRQQHYSECSQFLTKQFKKKVEDLRKQQSELRAQNKIIEQKLQKLTREYNKVSFQLKVYEKMLEDKNKSENRDAQKSPESVPKKKKSETSAAGTKKARKENKKIEKKEKISTNPKKEQSESIESPNIMKKETSQQEKEKVIQPENTQKTKRASYFGKYSHEIKKQQKQKPEVFIYQPPVNRMEGEEDNATKKQDTIKYSPKILRFGQNVELIENVETIANEKSKGEFSSLFNRKAQEQLINSSVINTPTFGVEPISNIPQKQLESKNNNQNKPITLTPQYQKEDLNLTNLPKPQIPSPPSYKTQKKRDLQDFGFEDSQIPVRNILEQHQHLPHQQKDQQKVNDDFFCKNFTKK